MGWERRWGASGWGDTCAPEATLCQWIAKTITICKVIILQLKINKKSSSTKWQFPKPKFMEYWDLTEKELKTAVMKKFNNLQKNSGSQYKDLRNKVNRIFCRREWNSKRVPNRSSGIEELNKWDEECIGNRADYMEKRISELRDRYIEMIQVEEERTALLFFKWRNPLRTICADYKCQLKNNGYSRRREGEWIKEHTQIIAENFQNLRK